MIKARYDVNLTGIPLDRSTPFNLYKIGLNYNQYLQISKVFGESSGSAWNGFSASHSWKQIVFRHVGSIWGRPPEINTKLILNN